MLKCEFKNVEEFIEYLLIVEELIFDGIENLIEWL